jgi:hypothetical protein
MSLVFIDTIQSALFGSTGSLYLIGIVILAFFIIAFVMIGLPFKYSIMFTSPLVLAFVEIGWFPQIISAIFWLLIAGLGIFVLWTQFSDR